MKDYVRENLEIVIYYINNDRPDLASGHIHEMLNDLDNENEDKS